MSLNLSTKERYLLEDQKTHEQICIQKYTNYANLAQEQQLKDIFTNHANIEREHLDAVNQLLNGQVPNLTQKHNYNTSTQNTPRTTPSNQPNNQPINSSFQTTDKDLCTDMLMTEKYVSSSYNSSVFEFKDTQVRDVLNHLQKDEQKHGEAIFKYMESNGMYSAQ